jgi:ABC-type glycerol-3-phosphate transport system substrate-binding protein
MKKARILAAFLAAVTMLSALASCAAGDDTTDSGESTAAETEATTDELKDNLPSNLNYGGNEVVFINDDNGLSVADEIYVKELNSDPVNDAIYERNKTVEARLNVKLSCIQIKGEVITQVITSINGGSADYDVMVERCWRAAPKTIDGYFANLRETEYIDFDQPWWTQGFNEVMQYKNLQFAITGAMVLSTYRRTHATVFNKKLFTDANQPFLYDHVENGVWTLDKQSSLVPLLARDNGNGTQDESYDTFGFVTNNFISADPYWAACDMNIIRAAGGDGYEWIFDSGKMHEAIDKILNLYYNTDNGTFVSFNDDSLQSKTQQIFSEGRAAMATLCIGALENSTIRNMEDAYGVVPMPKYDEAQTAYHSQMHDAFTIVCIPTTVQGDRLTQMSAVLEAMSSASYTTVRPTYYETTLRTKIAQDPQSSRMMELIIDGIYIDAGIVFSHNMNAFHKGIQQILTGKNNNTTSHFKSMESVAKKQLKTLTQKLEKLVED